MMVATNTKANRKKKRHSVSILSVVTLSATAIADSLIDKRIFSYSTKADITLLVAAAFASIGAGIVRSDMTFNDDGY